MPQASFFFPPCENGETGDVGGLMVPSFITVLAPGDLDNFVFRLRMLTAGNMYAQVREWTLTGHLTITGGPGPNDPQGDFSLVLKTVKSGTLIEYITDPPGEPDLCNHGGWYGEDVTQPNWFNEDGDPYDPGPITLRLGDALIRSEFKPIDGVDYCTVGARDTPGPTISFLNGFAGGTGISFGKNPDGADDCPVVATFTAGIGTGGETGFRLEIGGPRDSGGVPANAIGSLSLSPTRFWTYGGA